jgi:hypothetical protein
MTETTLPPVENAADLTEKFKSAIRTLRDHKKAFSVEGNRILESLALKLIPDLNDKSVLPSMLKMHFIGAVERGIALSTMEKGAKRNALRLEEKYEDASIVANRNLKFFPKLTRKKLKTLESAIRSAIFLREIAHIAGDHSLSGEEANRPATVLKEIYVAKVRKAMISARAKYGPKAKQPQPA